MPAYVESALNYANQNWPVFPCNPLDKRPLTHRGFLDATTDQQQIERWWKQWPNAMIGVPMGAPTNVFCVDLDIKEKADGRQMWSMLLASNNVEEPNTRVHETPSGGKHYLFIWQDGIRSIPLGKLAPGIEIKGNGGYIVVPPSRNSNGKDYISNGAECSYAPEWLLDMIREYRARRGEDVGATDEDIGTMDPELEAQIEQDLGKGFGTDTNRDFGDAPDVDAIRAALDAIPAEDYEDWYKLGAAIYRTLGEGGFSLFQHWSQKSKKYNAKDCARKWKQVQNMRDVNVGSIFFYADQADHNWRDKYEERREQAHAKTQEQIKPKQTTSKFRTYSLFPIDDRKIPQRAWLVPGLFERGHLTATAAPGGTGKSIFSLCVSIMVSLGKPWGDWMPRGEYRVLMFNLEEDRSEMQRRAFAAAALSMGITDNSVLQNRIIAAEYDTRLVVAKTNKVTRTLLKEPVVNDLKAYIRDEKFDLITVDPFAETFEGEENNRDLKYVGTLWREIARETQCAVWLIHHVKKYAQDLQGEMDALRGGGALGNIARIVTTMFTMTKDEAASLLELSDGDRLQFTRLDDAKSNYNKPCTEARWFKKETYDLQNSNADYAGDNVGAYIPWKPKTANIVQDDIDRAIKVVDNGIWADGQFTGEYFTFTRNSSRHVVPIIARTLGCSDQQATDFVNAWKRSQALVEFSYKNNQRKVVAGCASKSKVAEINKPAQQAKPEQENLI